MLAEEAEHGRHIGRDRIIDAEQIGDREMTPIVAVPPGEEEIGGTACLAGIALRQREQAGERAVDLTVLDHHLRLRRHHALRHALHRLSATGPRTAMVTRNADYARCARAKGPDRSDRKSTRLNSSN